MDATIAAVLTEPFPPEHVGKLPRITCKACSDASSRCCNEHNKSKCAACGNWITDRHIDLDYIGHADVTLRLLKADPDWTWEPAATDENGLPVFDTDDRDRPVGLWIRLTVGGVTRLGYGSVPANQGDAVKVLIGDALRNAAMRFGVATDLWAKGDRADPTSENATSGGGQAARKRKPPADAPDQAAAVELNTVKGEVFQVHKAAGYGSDPATIGETFERLTGMTWAEAKDDPSALRLFVAALRDDMESRNGAKAAS